MPFLKQQVELINEHLKQVSLKDQRFQSGRFISLARLAVRKDGDQNITMPIEMNNNYEAAWVGIDDTFPLVVYHRKLGSVYATAQRQMGRENNYIQEQADMLMVVFGKFANLKLTAEQLEAQIVASFPDVFPTAEIAGFGLTSMIVNLASSSSDSEVIFANEYRNVSYRLASEDIMLSVRYTIQTQFRKNCYDFCCDGSQNED